jgi:hypothetical protein
MPETERHFCTYFDHRYLPRGLALHASLLRHSPGAVLWVLCLSEICATALRRMALPGLVIVPLRELEAFDPELAASKGDRSLIEYYFTCSPCLPRFVLSKAQGVQAITYLDSDLYFFSSPEPIFDELADASVGIISHRFTPQSFRSHGKYGRYNVGWVYFRRDERGVDCLEWWHQQCLAWCHDRLEGDRYADQKYLESFEGNFAGVHAIAHPGANLAPWNIGGHRVGADGDGITVDGAPLVFFHFQGLRLVAAGLYDSNLTGYGGRMTKVIKERVFKPYLLDLAGTEVMLIRSGLLASIDGGMRRDAPGVIGYLRRASRMVRHAKAALAGNLVKLGIKPGVS